MNIRNLDLNLLIAFEALMQERSVTRAATRLGLSQPAVSSALRRLRQSLDDPLFLRTRLGIRPTTKAERMFVTVSQSLDSLQAALRSQSPFVAQQAERTFNVMMSDIGEIVYLPRLAKLLRSKAPGVRLSVRRLARRRVHEELVGGSIDLAIGWMNHSGDLLREPLFREDFVCVVRPDHPRVGRKLSVAQFLAEWHVIVGRNDQNADGFFSSADGNVERGLAQLAHRRKIAMLVPHFQAVPNIVATTDLLCVVPRQFGRVYADHGRLRIVPLPVQSDTFEVAQYWHRRFGEEAGNVWLRGVIRGLFAAKR